MEYANIRAFLAVIEHGSMSRAAQSLFLAQPTLSRQIRSLEESLGVQLFDRDKGSRSITLTAQGNAFLPLARKWEALWRESKQLARELPGARLDVLAIHSFNDYLLPEAYIRFAGKYPEVRLNIQTHAADDLCRMLEQGLSDTAFIVRTRYSRVVKTVPMFEEELMLVCGSRIPKRETVSVADLSPEDEVFLPWTPGLMQWHEYWFGTAREPKVQTNNTCTAEALLSLGRYWAILPRSMALSILQKTDAYICGVAEILPVRTGYLAMHTDHVLSKEMNCLLGEIKSVVLEQGSRWILE